MSVRELIDASSTWFVDSGTAPTRAIVYTHISDALDIPLNSFVSGDDLNQDLSDDKKVNKITCTVFLEEEPTKLDKILYNGKTYTVRMWTSLGTIGKYSVQAENAKRNKVTSRSFK